MLETARNEANLSFVTYNTQKKSRLRRSKTNPTLNQYGLFPGFFLKPKLLPSQRTQPRSTGNKGNRGDWGNKGRVMGNKGSGRRRRPENPRNETILLHYLKTAIHAQLHRDPQGRFRVRSELICCAAGGIVVISLSFFRKSINKNSKIRVFLVIFYFMISEKKIFQYTPSHTDFFACGALFLLSFKRVVCIQNVNFFSQRFKY